MAPVRMNGSSFYLLWFYFESVQSYQYYVFVYENIIKCNMFKLIWAGRRFPSRAASNLDHVASRHYPFVHLGTVQLLRLRRLATKLTSEAGGQCKPITAALRLSTQIVLECQRRPSNEIASGRGSQDTPTQPYPPADRLGAPRAPGRAGPGAPGGGRSRFFETPGGWQKTKWGPPKKP